MALLLAGWQVRYVAVRLCSRARFPLAFGRKLQAHTSVASLHSMWEQRVAEYTFEELNTWLAAFTLLSTSAIFFS